MGEATNNSIGIASVGFGNVKVMPVRALGKCGGFDSDIIAAMLWAAGISKPSDVRFAVPTPAKVLNLSLGGSGACSAAYQDAINQVTAAGAVVVVAAGNGDTKGVGTSVSSPANCTGVIAVGALRSAGDKVGFSNLGREVAISAPGRQLRQHRGESALPVPDDDDGKLLNDDPGGRRDGCNLYRQLQLLARHELLTLPNRTARVLNRSFSATGSNQEQRKVPAFWHRSRCAKAAAGFGATSWDPTHESVLHQPAGVLAS